MSYNKELNPMQALTESMTPKFAVSYLRVSTRGQAERGGGADEGFSIPAQREANKRKALSMGAMIGKEFVDRGASAKSADRPELQKMLEYVKENADRIDYVIIHKVDRLARNRGDDIDIMRVLRECGVQLVSASESIDDTPAGMLLHGIMSSIAEFYSQNLATEVKKGMSQKVKNGGTPTRAPLGYKNIRGYDDKGRRDSHVEVDEERAPLIKLAFEEYATGDWSLAALAAHLSDLGLCTPGTPKLPSKPIAKKKLHNILQNPYYKGIVTYNGVQYPGRHKAIIDEATWEKVQTVLKSHVNGERNRIHEHYLKSTVYCGQCGSRLIIHNAKSHTGTRYPYFVCIGRHDKKTNCKQRAVLIPEVESRIEQIYDRIAFTPDFSAYMQTKVDAQIDALAEAREAEMEKLRQEKAKLEREQLKLLQAHYEDAIPLHLLKDEQKRIQRSLFGIDEQMKARAIELSEAKEKIGYVFTLLENCGIVYRTADEQSKRQLNQAFFKKIYVYDDLSLRAEFNAPFDLIVNTNIFISGIRDSAIEEDAEQKEKNEQPSLAAHSLGFTQTYAQKSIFLGAGLSKDILVRLKGLEPTRIAAREPKGSVTLVKYFYR